MESIKSYSFAKWATLTGMCQKQDLKKQDSKLSQKLSSNCFKYTEILCKVACQRIDRVAKHEHIFEMVDSLENPSTTSPITKNMLRQIIQKSQKFLHFWDYKEQTWNLDNDLSIRSVSKDRQGAFRWEIKLLECKPRRIPIKEVDLRYRKFKNLRKVHFNDAK